MSASRLSIYNKSLRWLGERKLATLTEKREPRYLLDDEWSDAILYTLAQGNWRFGLRTIQANNEETQNPNFGFLYAFLKPDDWIKTYQIADNEVFEPLLRGFDDQNDYWYANISPIYVKYVSKDVRFGLNMALWTPGYAEYLGGYLAQMIVGRITQSEDKIAQVDKIEKRLRGEALSNDAMDGPVGRVPYGTWIMSRAPRGSILPYGSPYPWSLDD